MAENATQRKLTAIFSADVKGYSRLMGDDDEFTVSTITAYRKIISDVIEKHEGRVVDSPGDNILAEFGSTLNSVNSAIEIQQRLQTENGKLPDSRRMDFRIGINLGDIIHKDDRIYGDGVNVASRIESLADPGGICISRGVFDQVKKKVRQGFEYRGEHAVKNISEPVRIYRVLLAPEDEGRVIGEPAAQTIRIKWLTAVTVAVVIICSTALFWLYFPRKPDIGPDSGHKSAHSPTDGPSIAVLPFANLSGDPDQQYFSDGITEQIITSLSKLPYIFVIARQSSFAFRDKQMTVQQIARELDVNYILEGSVQQSGERIRINAQLIDAVSGRHQWAEYYDRQLNDIFELQDNITMRIITELQGKLTHTDLGQASSIKTKDLRAYEAYLKGYTHLWNRTVGDTLEARKMAQVAINIDPHYGAAYRLLAATYIDEIFLHRVQDRDAFLEEAETLIKKAIEYSGYDNQTHELMAQIYFLKKQNDNAIAEGYKATVLNPNSAHANFIYGMVLSLSARYDEAIPILNKAIRLNPIKPINYMNQLAIAYMQAEQYEKAIPLWIQTLERNPDYYYAHLLLCAVYQITGEQEKARGSAAELMRVRPDFKVSSLEKRFVSTNVESKARVLKALRETGLPE